MAAPTMKRRTLLGGTIAAGSLRAPVLSGQPGIPGKLRAGAATANITPPLGCSTAGGMTDRPASEVHDELQVRAVVLDNGRTRLALATCDLCVIPREPIERAKQLIEEHTGIPRANVTVAAVHTHSAPPADHLFQSRPDTRYVDFVVVRIADAVRRAVNRLQPARVGWGSGREERLLFNRRYFMKPGTMPPNPFGSTSDTVKMNPGPGNPDVIRPAGPIDPEVGVVAVESLEGRPITVLGNYSLHYVGDVGPGHISADYFAVWANSMARLAGLSGSTAYPPFVPILFNACSANINGVDVMGGNRRAVRRQPYERMQQVADMLAAESFRTWRNLEYSDGVELAASQEEVEVAVRLPNQDDLAWARKVLDAAPKQGQYKEISQIYARETVILNESFPKSVRVPVQAMRIGGMAFVAFPCEAFVELGLEIKAKSPFKPTFINELANGYNGYVPNAEGFDQGGYETWRAKSSYLEREAGPKVVAAALRRLAALA